MGRGFILGIQNAVLDDYDILKAEVVFQFLLQISVIIGGRIMEFDGHDPAFPAFLQHAQDGRSGHPQIITDLFLVHIVPVIEAAYLIDQPFIIYNFFHALIIILSIFQNICNNIYILVYIFDIFN